MRRSSRQRLASRRLLWRRDTAAAVLTIAMLLSASCGDEPVVVEDAPVITVSGVSAGEISFAPVTITIAVDKGTFAATLNGRPFDSGGTVSQPAEYTLDVTATAGGRSSSVSVEFRIALAEPTRLIVRLFDLGANESGGGGDAILLTDSSSAGMRHALVDAGPAGRDGADVGLVYRKLDSLGVDTLDAMILTHAHSDHFGGMEPVLRNLMVRQFYANGQVRNYAPYDSLTALAQLRAQQYAVPSNLVERALGVGDSASILVVIPPLTTFLGNAAASSSEINDGTIGSLVELGSFRMFLAGDGEVLANERWRTQYAAQSASVSVLKVGHHGGNDALFDGGIAGSSAWLDHSNPRAAVVSANGTTHPRINALAALLALPRLMVYCTNVHGDITIRVTQAGAFEVRVARNHEQVCTAGSEATT